MESDSSGGGERGASSRYQKRAPSREAVSVPLMHNLVQQGAVEELARILLCVADEAKASPPSDGARVGVPPSPSSRRTRRTKAAEKTRWTMMKL